MTTHDTYLQLAATAVDYPLAASERTRLEAHLAACPACARRAHAFRGDALALGHLPRVTLPERRGSEILAAALHPGVVRHPVRLLVLAALLGLLLVGSLAVGAQLLRTPEDELSVIVPVPSASPGPDASPWPDASPSAGPDATVTPLPTATPASGEILVDVGDEVRIIEPSGREVGQAPSGSIGPLAAWSPNGEVVAYPDLASSKQAVVIWDATSTAEVGRIADAYAPSWSPDGTQLAYCRGSIANPGDPCPEVWIASASGANAKRLGGGWHGPLPWSPDGRLLLSPTLGTGTREPFQLIDVATGQATPLGDPRGCYDVPAWLPGASAAGGDGLVVVAIRDPGCKAMFPTPMVIVALDVATGGESSLTDGTAANSGLAVSPDGRWIAVGRSLTGQPGSQYGVIVMASDGSGARLLTPPDVSEFGPAWSPDGALILVDRSTLEGEPLGLYLIDPTSATTIAVPGTTGATGRAWRPAWAGTQPGEPAPSAQPLGTTRTQAPVPVVPTWASSSNGSRRRRSKPRSGSGLPEARPPRRLG